MVEVTMSYQSEISIVGNSAFDISRAGRAIQPYVHINIANALGVSVVAKRNLEPCVSQPSNLLHFVWISKI